MFLCNICVRKFMGIYGILYLSINNMILFYSVILLYKPYYYDADLFSVYTFILNMSEVSDVFFLPQGCSY